MYQFPTLLFFSQDDPQGAVKLGNAEEFTKENIKAGARTHTDQHISGSQDKPIGGVV